MDVTCQQCSSEYEFDETLIAERGTTVKCTNCGHQFKVFRSGTGDARPWEIRHGDGRVETISSLRALQKRITDGTLTRDDQVARQGDPYKPLGSIAELESFFLQAEDNAETLQMQQPTGPRKSKGTLMGYSPSPDSLPPPADYNPDVAPAAPAPSVPPPVSAEARRQSSRPPAVGQMPTKSADLKRTRASDMRPLIESDPPPPPRKPRRPRPVRNVADDNLDDIQVKGLKTGKKKGGAGKWLLLLLLAGVAGAGYWKRDLVMEQYTSLTSGTSPAARFLADAERHLASDDADGYDDAIHELTRATAVAERDPDVLAGLSRAYALKAQLLEFDAQDLDAEAESDPARAGEAAGMRRVARDAAQSARRMAEDAFRIAPESAVAEIALADAQRLTGDLTGARTHYDAGIARVTRPGAEQLRVGALLAAAEAESLASAKDLAQQAVERDPDMIRTRLLLARALIAEGNAEGARAHVDRVLSAHNRHERALAVRRRLNGEAPQPTDTTGAEEQEGDGETDPAAATTTDGSEATGATDDGAERSTDDSRDDDRDEDGADADDRRDDRAFDEMQGGATGDPAAADDSAELVDGRPPAGRDYSWYVRQGDSALRSGALGRAQLFYHAALEVRPGSAEATTGMGNVALRRGRNEDAAGRFRQASRNGYGPALIGLGRANEALGRRSNAIQAYEDYLRRSPNGGMARTARRRLEALGRRTPSSTPMDTPTPAPAPTTPTPSPDPTPAPSMAPPPPPSEPTPVRNEPPPPPSEPSAVPDEPLP